jgi:hypothetical protein
MTYPAGALSIKLLVSSSSTQPLVLRVQAVTTAAPGEPPLPRRSSWSRGKDSALHITFDPTGPRLVDLPPLVTEGSIASCNLLCTWEGETSDDVGVSVWFRDAATRTPPELLAYAPAHEARDA